MPIPQPGPLYATYQELAVLQLGDYPQLSSLLNQQKWHPTLWQWGADFLRYIGKNKSEHTYTRFRNDIERFCLWAMLFKQSDISEYRKADILEFIDFCVAPPQEWIGHAPCDRFVLSNGYFQTNPQWRPFILRATKVAPGKTPDKRKYRPSQQTITSCFVALTAFYRYLQEEEVCFNNPVPLAKRDCRHLIKNSQVKSISRLNAQQWQFVLKAAEQQADEDGLWERQLFVVSAMKTLFLRVSELSERRDWLPMMSHFWQDDDGNWWFTAYGKGKKIRDISVPPDFLHYLKRYREWRGLLPLPYAGEQEILVEKIRGRGGITSRQLTRLVQQVFDLAYEKMSKQAGADAAQQLKIASTHYLRHTGASMEIERDRPLKDLSEDLGHASSATTDTVYVQVERKRRAASGKKRTVS